MQSISVLASLLLIVFVNVASPFLFYPSHASCKIDWTFGMGCSGVVDAIKAQIKAWEGDDCGTGEKCLYKFVSFDENVLKATHETPKQHYVDDLSFTFDASKSGASSCSVQGFSTSQTWYAYLDYSTNYCNLHNLIAGASLDKTEGYNEKTSNSQCTQYTSRNCDKY